MQMLHSSIAELGSCASAAKGPVIGQRNGIRRFVTKIAKEKNMAFITDTRTGGITLTQRIAALRENFVAARAQRKIYTKTVSELDALSNRDLADLGINRSMIKAIAIEAAYGK